MMIKKSEESTIRDLKFNPHDLACEELRHIYKGKTSSRLIVPLIGAVTTCLLIWDIGWQFAGIWYIWLLIAYTWHWWLGRLDWTSTNVRIELARIDRHVMAAAVAGLGWGGLSFTIPLMSLSNKAAVLIVMLIAVVTALPRFIVFLPIFFAFSAGVFIPLILICPFLDFETLHMVLVTLVVVGATLWASAREVRKILIDVLLKQVLSEQASWEDRLTGIGNRRSFDANIATLWAQASRAKAPLSLIMVDVDFFKKFNDAYGHQAGDACLRQVASALSGCARRAGDSVTRYGGEEFAVVLFHTTLNEARNISENMLRAVRKLNIVHEQSEHEVVTVSMGLATIVATVEFEIQELIEQADKSLYRAKTQGRNRVESQMLDAFELGMG